MTKNQVTGQFETAAAEMTDSQVLSYRKWPAHLTIAQMRSEIAWHQSPNFRRAA